MTAPSAVGTLADTPLAHALIYARNRRLSGRLELTNEEQHATITLWRGRITAVETEPLGMCPGGFFGAVVYELGFIDSGTLDETLLEVATSKRLHGEVLIERGRISAAQRDEVLVEQVHRKVHHLFSLPLSTRYAFYDAKIAAFEPPIAVDPVGPVWRGIRDYPPGKFVEETIRRVGDNALRVTAGGSARLPPAETALAEALAARPMNLAQMKATTSLPASRVELLVYLLVIAKCVEAVSGVRTHPSTGALPTTTPSGPMHNPSPEARRLSTEMSAARHSNVPGAPPSGGAMPSRSPMGVPTPSGIPPRIATPSRSPMGVPTPSGIPPRIATPSKITMGIPTSSGELPRASSGALPRVTIPSGMSPKVGGRTISSPRIPAQSGPLPGTLAALRTPAEYGIEGLIARAETVEEEDFFHALGVADGASAEAVRAAFVRLAKTWHPDRLQADLHPVRTAVAKVFSHMARAHQTLCNEEARREYIAAKQAKNAARPRKDVIREIEYAMGKRNFEFAMERCEELLASDSDDAEALAIHAWASVRGGEATDDELRAALTRMDKAVNLDRTNDQAIYHRGLVHKRLNNVPAAFRDFARAVQLNPKHVEAEREVRIFAMRARKGSGEYKLALPLIEKLGKK